MMGMSMWAWVALGCAVAAVWYVRGSKTEGGADEGPRWIAEGAALVDVRTEAEYAAGHLEGAINIPVQVLPNRLDELDATRPTVVYCRSGGRSARAASILDQAGFQRILDAGAMSSWPK